MKTILNNSHQVRSCSDAHAAPYADSAVSTSERNFVTHQTGRLLVTLGKMFITLPAFNSHIDNSTGKLLINIGRKLKKTKE